jgi:hypothetical protein
VRGIKREDVRFPSSNADTDQLEENTNGKISELIQTPKTMTSCRKIMPKHWLQNLNIMTC